MAPFSCSKFKRKVWSDFALRKSLCQYPGRGQAWERNLSWCRHLHGVAPTSTKAQCFTHRTYQGLDRTRKIVELMDHPTRCPMSIPLWHGQLKGQVPALSPLSQLAAHGLKQAPSGSQLMAQPQEGLSRLKVLTKQQLSRPRHI